MLVMPTKTINFGTLFNLKGSELKTSSLLYVPCWLHYLQKILEIKILDILFLMVSLFSDSFYLISDKFQTKISATLLQRC